MFGSVLFVASVLLFLAAMITPCGACGHPYVHKALSSTGHGFCTNASCFRYFERKDAKRGGTHKGGFKGKTYDHGWNGSAYDWGKGSAADNGKGDGGAFGKGDAGKGGAGYYAKGDYGDHSRDKVVDGPQESQRQNKFDEDSDDEARLL